MAAIARFIGLDRRRKVLIVAATLALGAMSAALRLLPFRTAIRLGSVALGTGPAGDPGDLVWAVRAAAPRVPWRAKCIEQGLALQWLLRRRGVPARLHYGVGRGDAEALTAHVWVSLDDEVILGGEELARFGEVAVYPSN